MTRPNFFCDLKTFIPLSQMRFTGDHDDIDLTVDIIDEPYLLVFTSDDETSTLKIFERKDMYMHTEDVDTEAGRITIDKKTNNGKIRKNWNTWILNNIPGLWQACRNLSKFIQENHLEDVYQDLDPETAGIILTEEEGKINWKAASGKELPDLKCFRKPGSAPDDGPCQDGDMGAGSDTDDPENSCQSDLENEEEYGSVNVLTGDHGTDNALLERTKNFRIRKLIERIKWENRNFDTDGFPFNLDDPLGDIQMPSGKFVMESNYSWDENTRTVVVKDIELIPTASDTGLERLRAGEKLNLYPAASGQYLLKDMNGEETGMIKGMIDELGPVFKNHDAETVEAFVSEVIPKSKQRKDCGKTAVKVNVILKLKKIERKGVKSIVCRTFVGINQDILAQKVDVLYTGIPAEDAKTAFEIYNRDHYVYSSEPEEPAYYGLDELTAEARAARKKLRFGIVPGQTYEKFSEINWSDEFSDLMIIAYKAEPERYSSLLKYIDPNVSLDYISDELDDFFGRYAIDQETYYWIDRNRVTKAEYEEQTGDHFDKRFIVMELFQGDILPVDLKDEETAGVYGTDQFIAFADISNNRW